MTKRTRGPHVTSEHDHWLRGLLAKRLMWDGDRFVWPPSMRSALLTRRVQ